MLHEPQNLLAKCYLSKNFVAQNFGTIQYIHVVSVLNSDLNSMYAMIVCSCATAISFGKGGQTDGAACQTGQDRSRLQGE